MSAPSLTTHYERLGVRPDAGMDAVKRAFRELARRMHPDVNPVPTAHAEMQGLNEAYSTLVDPNRRAAYDAALVPSRSNPNQNALRRTAERTTTGPRFCADCWQQAGMLYARRVTPCEWCSQAAATCAPRQDEADISAVHVWLCDRCLNQQYLHAA